MLEKSLSVLIALRTHPFFHLISESVFFFIYKKRKRANLSFALQLYEFDKDSAQMCALGRREICTQLVSGATVTCPSHTSELGLQRLQVLVVGFMDLCLVQWGFLGPLKQVFIHIPIISTKNRA